MIETRIETNRSAPTAAVVPVLVYADVEAAIEELVTVFGFTERVRAKGPDGRVMHAQLSNGNGAIMLGRQGGPFRAPASEEIAQYVHVTVSDVDAHHARAAAAGVRIWSPPENMPFGERQYTARDAQGHWWTFSQHVADVAPDDWGANGL